MSKLGKIVKDTIKAKKESVMGKLGNAPFEDPMEPWSAKYNAPIKEEAENLEEESVLYRYIRSKGYSPEHMDFAHRSAFARSRAFKTYKVMHLKKKEQQQGGIHDIKRAIKKEEVSSAAKIYNSSAETAKAKLDAMKAMATTKAYEKKALTKAVSEEQLAEAGVGGLMNFIRSKGLDPTSMDGNHKKHYARSSEYRVFKTVQPDADEAKSVFKEREKAKEDMKKPKKVNETSGMGERGEDWNDEYTDMPIVKVKAKKLKEEVDEKDTVTMDIPLLIRVLEYAREDAKTDMDLHKVVENLINMRGGGTMTMDMYNKIVSIKEEIEKLDEISKELANRYYWSAKSDDEKRWKAIGSEQEKQSTNYSKSRHKKVVRMLSKSSKRWDGRQRALKRMEESDEAKYGKDYQAMVLRVGEKAKKKPVDMKSLAARMQASYAKGGKQLKELKKQDDNQELDSHITREEVEQLSELSKGTLKSYIKKRGETIQADKAESNVARNRAADLEYRGKQAQADTNHDEADALRQRARKGATNVTKAAIKIAKKTSKEKVNEACSCETKKQSMKSARIIKSLYKKKLKESTYDWEKDDKGNSKKTTAKITVKGGTTMTGKPRDTVEIEPVLKTRPSSHRP